MYSCTWTCYTYSMAIAWTFMSLRTHMIGPDQALRARDRCSFGYAPSCTQHLLVLTQHCLLLNMQHGHLLTKRIVPMYPQCSLIR